VNVKPDGSVPAPIDHLYGLLPPDALQSAE
jgi:hypothetical protein